MPVNVSSFIGIFLNAAAAACALDGPVLPAVKLVKHLMGVMTFKLMLTLLAFNFLGCLGSYRYGASTALNLVPNSGIYSLVIVSFVFGCLELERYDLLEFNSSLSNCAVEVDEGY